MTVVFRSGANYLMQNKSQSQTVLTEKVKRVMDVAIDKEIEKYENKLTSPCNSWFSCTFYWIIRNSLGNYEFFSQSQFLEILV